MAIELKGVTKRYGATTALDKVSVSFGGGIVYGLLGANGAGKTTMMNVITNRIFADEGEVLIDGERAPGRDKALGRVYMMAEANLFPDSMKVEPALRLTKSFYPSFDMDYALAVAKRFELPLKKKVKSLSTGYASIFRLTLALAVSTPYVIFDEPVLGLDAQHRDLFYRLLMERAAQTEQTVILSTHLIQEAASLISHAVIIHSGRILRDMDTAALTGAAYQVSGPAAAVDAYCAGRHVLNVNSLGGLKTACVEGEPEAEAPAGSKMRFAPIFKYRMRDCLSSGGVVMLVMVVMTVLSYFGIVTFGGYEESVDGVVTERFATMNFTMPYVIFMFVVGIVTIREDMRIGIQNGAGRTTSFLANLACLAATALLLNLNCLVFYKLWALLDTELIIIDLYSMAFLQEMTPDTLGEMLMCFITGTAASLALAGCGVMLSLVYWRLGKAGKWILSLGMGAAFILFINASASYDWLRLALTNFFVWVVKAPINMDVFFLALAAVFFGIGRAVTLKNPITAATA